MVGRAFGERVPASRLVPQLVEAGHVGRRTGAGFYIWTKPSLLGRLARRPSRVPNPAVRRLLGAVPTRSLSAEAIQERLVLLFINEAIRCLDEGVVGSPVDADLGAVLGLGFPPFLGGPLHEADRLGLAALEGRLGRLAERHGPRYAPAGLLVNKARRGESFYPKEP
jgi:3-hydroxyacyl-CoA dehydrogenase/enoyl-CoA hydratase/3-hydroxybutyryl-CoA epimerase